MVLSSSICILSILQALHKLIDCVILKLSNIYYRYILCGTWMELTTWLVHRGMLSLRLLGLKHRRCEDPMLRCLACKLVKYFPPKNGSPLRVFQAKLLDVHTENSVHICITALCRISLLGSCPYEEKEVKYIDLCLFYVKLEQNRTFDMLKNF